MDDLHRTLSQVRKKATKLGSELNDLKVHLENQQTRNAELEKRQRRWVQGSREGVRGAMEGEGGTMGGTEGVMWGCRFSAVLSWAGLTLS